MAEIDRSKTDHPVFILCDYAEVLNGKLYVMGGGFDAVRAGVPLMLSLGVILQIPWHQTNQAQKIRSVLVTEDGEPVASPDGQPLIIEGEVEIGRPPGAKHGTTFPTPLAVRLPPIVFDAKPYRFELHLNGSIEAVASFRGI